MTKLSGALYELFSWFPNPAPPADRERVAKEIAYALAAEDRREAPDACVCGDRAARGVIHRTDGPCFHRPGPRLDVDPLEPEDHARCAAEAPDAGAAGMPVAWAVYHRDGTVPVLLADNESGADSWIGRSECYRVVPLYALPLTAPDAVETARREGMEAAIGVLYTNTPVGFAKCIDLIHKAIAAEAERAKRDAGAEGDQRARDTDARKGREEPDDAR